MTDQETTFEADPTPPELEEARGDSDIQTLTSNRASDFEDATARQPCSNGDCPYSSDPGHPLEQTWIELMSPVPKENQSISLAPSPGVAQPNALIFGEIVEALRPSGIAAHSIETIRTGWRTLLDQHLNDVPGRLASKLTELSQHWEGDDFDSFAEQVEIARTNFIEALDEIDTATTELQNVEERIYADQGGGSCEIPFPAPDVWRAGSSMINDSKIHVRPAWATGDCSKDRGEGESWENLGLPEDFTQSLNELVEQRAAQYVESGMDPGEAQMQAMSDYDQSLFDYGEHFSETMKRASDEYNAGIEDLHYDITQAQGEPSLEHNTRTPPVIEDADFSMPDPELDPPPTPEPPPLGDFGSDYDVPPADPPDLPDPQSNLGGVPTGGGLGDYGSPGGLGSPGSVTGGSGLDADDNPWGASGDDDEIGGGLASGGGVGAPGGLPGGGGVGAPSGAGAAGGVGGAVMPGVVGGAGGARGAGAGGRGAGRGATARGATGRGAGRGMPGMMGGGGRGAAGTGEDEQSSETWLTEDEDVWGIGNEEDDPYA